ALFHYIFTWSKASYTATKSPARGWPERRVSTSRVQIPAQTTAGSPDCAAHALINARDVSFLRFGSRLNGSYPISTHVYEGSQDVLDLRLQHVDDRRVSQPCVGSGDQEKVRETRHCGTGKRLWTAGPNFAESASGLSANSA